MNSLNLDKNCKYLLACSFGPDSMALFYLLENGGYNFDCAIVNYHLREESDFEVAELQKYCDSKGKKLFVLDVIDKIIKNVESECRKIRYQFFSELTDKYGFDATLVAHHQDDKIETFLLQKLRQNCPIYFGIKEKTVINNVTILRPLLDYSKSDLLNICVNNNIPFSVDKTNFDISIKRNKIRHELVAKMSKKDRADILSEIENKNNTLSNMFMMLNDCDLSDVNIVTSLEPVEQRYALNLLAEKVNKNIKLSKENVGQIISILKSNKPNYRLLIKKGLVLLKEYDKFYLLKESNKSNSYCYTISSPSKLVTPYFYLDFTGETSNRNVKADDYPLVIRNIKKTDRYKIKDYEVKANRLLIDWKVPQELREIWPVIINKNNKVIYIPRYRKEFVPDSKTNFFVKVS